jgi:hypothetical protein
MVIDVFIILGGAVFQQIALAPDDRIN